MLEVHRHDGQGAVATGSCPDDEDHYSSEARPLASAPWMREMVRGWSCLRSRSNDDVPCTVQSG
jgi:hypothetical protein